MKKKGEYGYLNYQKIIEIIKTIILFSASIGIYILGYVTMQTNKNLWTVIAILGVLPASKSAVNMIMFLRFGSIKKETYEKYCDAKGSLPALFETVLTTTEKAYFVPLIVCVDNTLCAFCKKEDKEIKKLEKYIRDTLEKSGSEHITVKVFSDENVYLKRVCEMKENFPAQTDQSAEDIFSTIKAVSL